MKNENILIFGDSYSTFEGYIPEGFHVYYPKCSKTVTDVSKTWWHMLASETNSKIILNNSWSGSTICNTGYDGDCSTTSSFICRLNKLIDDGFFSKNQIDRVFVFGASNDSWSGNDCGQIMFDNWTADDLKLILPGISYFMDRLASVIPNEKIHFILNDDMRKEVIDGILTICDHYNIGTTIISEVEKYDGHPTFNGMTTIKNQVLANIK